MDNYNAYDVMRKYQSRSVITKDEEFQLIEAYMYVIDSYKDAAPDSFLYDNVVVAMFNLAHYYKRNGEYKLALKYYCMCAENDEHSLANSVIADIYFSGNAGKKDYAKAFRYYSLAAKDGSLEAKLRLADMYRYGYYVERDYNKYRDLIYIVYRRILDSPVPSYKGEALFKMAEIIIEDGLVKEGIDLLLKARKQLEEQLLTYSEGSDLDIMKKIIRKTYHLIRFEQAAEFSLYDLYYILEKPVYVEFTSPFGQHIVSSYQERQGITVKLDDKWYESIDDLFYNANILLDSFNYSDFSNGKYKIRHINGNCTNPIFGIDIKEEERKKDGIEQFTKTSRRIKQDAFGHSIEKSSVPGSIKRAIVYGHSLNEMDYDYFNYLFTILRFNTFDPSKMGTVEFVYSIYDDTKKSKIRRDFAKNVYDLLNYYEKYTSRMNQHILINLLRFSGKLIIREL